MTDLYNKMVEINNKLTGVVETGVAVADIGTTSDLSLTAPDAATQGATYDQTALNTALDLKADQAKVATMVAAAESRLDVIEAKVDELLASLRGSTQITT